MKSIFVVFILLVCTTLVYSQEGNVISAQQETQSAAPPISQGQQQTATTTTAQQATTTTTEAQQQTTTTEAQQQTTTTTQQQQTTTTTTTPIQYTSNIPQSSNTQDQAITTTTSSDTSRNTNHQRTNLSQTPTNTDTSTSTPTAFSADSNAPPKQEDKTAIIAGSVVGGLVGVALIAGLITWMNRRGGCTSRTRRRDVPVDFEEPQHHHENDYNMKQTTSGAEASSPFARRFVPPTANTGYMNLNDEEYYHQSDYNSQPYEQPYASQEQPQPYYQDQIYNQNYIQPEQPYYQSPNAVHATVTPSTTTTFVQQLKPDQIEQKPNVA